MAKLSSTQIYGDLQVDGEIKNKASTTSEGVVQLNDNVNSTSTTQGATANAVKKVNDTVASHTTNTTSHITASERTTWNGKLDKTGGNMSGNITFDNDKGVYAKSSSGDVRTLLRILTSDEVYMGTTTTPLALASKTNPRVSVAGTYYTIYHTGNKPTPDDIGASASSHGHDYYVQGTTSARTTDQNGNNNDLKKSGFYRCSATAGTTNIFPGGLHSHILHGQHPSGVYAYQMGFPYSNKSKVFFRSKDSSDTWGDWHEFYHTGNKPTASDVGALPISGGTLTGNLTIKTNVAEAISAISGDYTALMGCSSSTKGDFLFGGKTTSSSSWENYIRLSTNKLIFYTDGKNYNIYHQGNKPTPSEIGTNKVYNSLSEIGSGFSVTTPLKDVILAMEDNSMAVYEVGSTQGIYPQGYSTVVIYKVNSGRNVVFCRSNGTSSLLYTTNYHSSSNVNCEWRKVCDGGNADTVDGKHASDFVQTTGGSISGNLLVSGTTDLVGNVGCNGSVYLKVDGSPVELNSYLSALNAKASTGTIKSVQRGMYHLNDASSGTKKENGIAYVDITISAVNVSKSFVIYNSSGTSSGSDASYKDSNAKLINSTTLRLYSTYAFSTWMQITNGNWQVIEFY